MKRDLRPAMRRTVSLAGVLVLLAGLAPAARADRGSADLSIGNRSHLFRNPFGGAADASETVFHFGLVQTITNYGTVSLWADGLAAGGVFTPARLFAGWRGFKIKNAELSAGLGDGFFVNSNLESRFVNQYHPYFYFRGLNASISGPAFDLSVFGGTLARLTGLLGSTYEIKDQPFYGIRGRWKRPAGGLAGAGIIHTRRDPADPAGPEKNTLILLDAEAPVAEGAKILGEFQTSLTPGSSGPAGSANALRFGPFFRSGKWNIEANYRFTGSRFCDLNPDYQSIRDEQGLFASVRYQASRNLVLFGFADRFADNTGGDPAKNTLRSLSVISGFYLNTRSLFDLSLQWEFQQRISEHDFPGSVDFASNGIFLQASRTMGDFFPYLRVKLQNVREGPGLPSSGLPVIYLGFRKRMPRGSFLWVEGQYDHKRNAEAGLIDRNLYVRTGWNQVFSPDFDLYAELFYERYGAVQIVSQIVAYVGVRVGLGRSLQARADIRASEPLNRRDIRSSDYQFTLRLDKRFSWGQEPKIMGRKTVGAVLGIGSIEGYVFEDTNGDGLMSPGEKGLAGVSLRLEDGSRAMTGEDGRFRFPMVAEGPHQVQIEENLIPATYYLLSPARVDVLTQARITREVSFPLISGASLKGRFIEDSDRNGTMDPADKGLADILVILTPIDGAVWKDLILNTYTDAGGAYRFMNILPGEYELSVDPETLPAGAVTAVPLPFKIKLEPGRTAGGVDFLVIPRPVIRKK